MNLFLNSVMVIQKMMIKYSENSIIRQFLGFAVAAVEEVYYITHSFFSFLLLHLINQLY